MEVDARSIATHCLLDYCYILTTTQACNYYINNTFTNILLLWFGFSKVLMFVLLVFCSIFLTAWLGLGLAWLLLSGSCRLCCCWLCWVSSCFPAGVGPLVLLWFEQNLGFPSEEPFFKAFFLRTLGVPSPHSLVPSGCQLTIPHFR